MAHQQVLPPHGRIDGHRHDATPAFGRAVRQAGADLHEEDWAPGPYSFGGGSTVMGGMRIQVGDEVTDNTVVAQLENLKRKVKAGVSE